MNTVEQVGIFIYGVSYYLLFILIWYGLRYVEKAHVRERARRIGNNIYNNIGRRFFTHCGFIQMATLFDILAGLLEGLSGEKPMVQLQIKPIDNTEQQVNPIDNKEFESSNLEKMKSEEPDIVTESVEETKPIDITSDQTVSNVFISHHEELDNDSFESEPTTVREIKRIKVRKL